ncbi:MAG: fused MFS/spermidine synthase [Myxococcaceae bacterium]|nr:fused MFS/spermidine synthase [Myxococcaceae bacterium]
MRLPVALLLAGLVGYISLSQEILWFRVVSYSDGGRPQSFGHVLGAFLIGIALGALVAKHLTERRAPNPGWFGAALALAAPVFYLSIPLVAQISARLPALTTLSTWAAVMGVALCSGVVFPLLSHFAIREGSSVGSGLSWVYFCNIVGSILGPLFTTFVLMDRIELGQLIRLVAGLMLAAALVATLTSASTTRMRRRVVGAVLVSAAALILLHRPLYGSLIETLHWNEHVDEHGPFEHIVQTRSGIIAVERRGIDHLIFGDGVYDGAFNVDPVADVNGIRRGYALAMLHRNPVKVLEIGLSSASWTWVLARHRGIQRIQSVEINPGYLEVIRHFPEQSTVPSDPKVSIAIDDGRRWLNRNPGAKFDAIVMNTSFFWRSMSTNLLSGDFLEQLKAHLEPGGVVFYNTTGSDDVRHTAAQHFRHVVRVATFIACSDAPFDQTPEERRRNLLQFVQGPAQRPILDPDNPETAAVLDELVQMPLEDEAEALRARTAQWTVTDDNMATEYKSGVRFFDPEVSWSRLFERVRR